MTHVDVISVSSLGGQSDATAGGPSGGGPASCSYALWRRTIAGASSEALTIREVRRADHADAIKRSVPERPGY